ncbi:MAG: dihydrofolate reductase family protein [Myxococcota bacterium]
MTRPHIVINMASSVDGKITSAAREYPRLTSRRDKLLMDRIRAESDAVVIGAGTLRADDPPLQVRDAAMRAHRLQHGKATPLMCVLVSRRLEVSPEARFFADNAGARLVIATCASAPAAKIARLSDRAEIWQLGETTVDLTQLVARLHAEGVARLLVEGGGELNWGFVAAGLVDEIYLTLAPTLLGGRDAPTLLEGEGLTMAEQQRLELIDVRAEDSEVFLHYRVALKS